MVEKWDTNHEGLRQIFCAALSGICANPHFIDSHQYQGSHDAAVEFANKVVEAAVRCAIPPADSGAG